MLMLGIVGGKVVDNELRLGRAHATVDADPPGMGRGMGGKHISRTNPNSSRESLLHRIHVSRLRVEENAVHGSTRFNRGPTRDCREMSGELIRTNSTQLSQVKLNQIQDQAKQEHLKLLGEVSQCRTIPGSP